MFSLCLDELSVGTPASFHSPKMGMFGLIGDSKLVIGVKWSVTVIAL